MSQRWIKSTIPKLHVRIVITATGGVKLRLIMQELDIHWKVPISNKHADHVILNQMSRASWYSNSQSCLPAVQNAIRIHIRISLRNLQAQVV